MANAPMANITAKWEHISKTLGHMITICKTRASILRRSRMLERALGDNKSLVTSEVQRQLGLGGAADWSQVSQATGLELRECLELSQHDDGKARWHYDPDTPSQAMIGRMTSFIKEHYLVPTPVNYRAVSNFMWIVMEDCIQIHEMAQGKFKWTEANVERAAALRAQGLAYKEVARRLSPVLPAYRVFEVVKRYSSHKQVPNPASVFELEEISRLVDEYAGKHSVVDIATKICKQLKFGGRRSIYSAINLRIAAHPHYQAKVRDIDYSNLANRIAKGQTTVTLAAKELDVPHRLLVDRMRGLDSKLYSPKWTDEETRKLIDLMQSCDSQPSHSFISKVIGTKSVAQCAAAGIIAGYAPGWKDIGNVDMSKYTHINLAYAEPQANGTFTMESSYNIDQVADKIHRAGSRALLSLGGYSGSRYISDILKSSDTRTTLIAGVVEYLKIHGLDGIDVDWVPSPCNHVDLANDSSNLLVFVRELRQALEATGAKKLIALGVGMSPFPGPSGQPLADVSAYANWVDYINILAYDVNSQQETTGPNAPLNFEYGRGVQQSLVGAIDNWTRAKFPAGQITAGLAFYGRAAVAKTDMSMAPWNVYQAQESEVPRGDIDDGLWSDRCTGKPASYSGVWSYGNLRKQVLQSPDTTTPPWQRFWDSVSLTPWVFNPGSKMFISYDDPASVSAKVSHVLGKGLGGVTVYDITMDFNGELVNVVRDAVKPDSSKTTLLPSASPTSSDMLGWPSSSESATLSPAPSSSSQSSSAPPPSSLPPPPPPPPPTILPVPSSSPSPPPLALPPADNGLGGPRAGSECGWQASYSE
ncbi:hypothetical protein LPJ60_003262 [Coemansia sp. RSA 2675]|nr:hypothetical protein LPJ60_003262 [Coemansia sp. RSA 2675]